ELLIVIVIMGAIMIIAFPRMQAAYQASAVRGARTRLIAIYGAARAAAVQSNRPVRVHFNGNNVWVTATPRLTVGGSGTADTIGPVQSLYSAFGVSLAAGVDSLMLDPRGLGLNGGSLVVSNAHGADTLTITGFGRVKR
ncbi:MAG: GspH/FimT family pseudopilin, partial [Gemmatimonadota bacterium]|nr:GspH/FimT family pseudopilin [Gemmatimonadota bacterium]